MMHIYAELYLQHDNLRHTMEHRNNNCIILMYFVITSLKSSIFPPYKQSPLIVLPFTSTKLVTHIYLKPHTKLKPLL